MVLAVVITASLLAWQYVLRQNLIQAITNFEECVKAGYPVMESYPAQCRTPDGKHFTETISKYSGQEVRAIKSLSPEDIDSLERGTGDAFGGLAKLAELNGFPGPRHVLDLESELQLTSKQMKVVEKMNDAREREAQALGQAIIQIEGQIDSLFVDKTITDKILYQKLVKSAELYGQLRYVHLKYHLAMLDTLTPTQVKLYNELRGYSGAGDPCQNIPEGHDREQWKKHNNCT